MKYTKIVVVAVHAGSQRQAGQFKISIRQSPISPLGPLTTESGLYGWAFRVFFERPLLSPKLFLCNHPPVKRLSLATFSRADSRDWQTNAKSGSPLQRLPLILRKSWDNSFDGGASWERIDNNNSLFFRGNHSFEERWQFCKGGHVCRQLHCLSLAMLFIQRMVVS